LPSAWTLDGKLLVRHADRCVDGGEHEPVRKTFAVVTGAVLLLAGCSSQDDAGGRTATEASAEPSAAPAEVTLSIEDGATDVSPVIPLEISVTDGELADVELVGADGAEVPGAVEDGAEGAPDVWSPEEHLAYGTEYTITATATNAADEETEASAAFTTVTPSGLFTPSIGPLDGTVVGVGMPIRVYFDAPVPDEDKAAVERNLEVTSSTPTDGAWSWLTDTEVHFRPSEYWPANTEVTLDANLYGVHVGDGVWGEVDRSISFTIGERHVSVADAGTHTMKVYDGDELVKTFPISAGGPDFPSRNGPHVVTELNRDRVMDSSTYGVPVDSPNGYRTPVEYAVRLSNNGEFVHAAPWSVAQQGRENVSHGCINMSTERAAWFFDFSQPGDVVEIVNSQGPTLSAADGDIYDWAIPWDEWQAGSALK
jgi:lipoprotein-anchoring transpeptidase ErfK/SrfK